MTNEEAIAGIMKQTQDHLATLATGEEKVAFLIDLSAEIDGLGEQETEKADAEEEEAPAA